MLDLLEAAHSYHMNKNTVLNYIGEGWRELARICVQCHLSKWWVASISKDTLQIKSGTDQEALVGRGSPAP